MGVYIRGMEMPSCCEKCPVNTKDAFGGIGCRVTGYIPLRKADQDFPNWCPLVPVPPHGDLIDRDAYLYSGDLVDEPVIIPAEEGEP